MARFHLNIDYPLEKMELIRRRIEARAEFRYVDGAHVCPGTPLASFQAMMDAAEEFGLGDGKLPRWNA
jgi:hypothetical protein